MTDLNAQLSTMHRPKILIRTARAGIQQYRRSRDLKRISGMPANTTTIRVLDSLIRVENQMDIERKDGDASYSIRKHVAVMTALLAEANAAPSIKMAA